MKQFAKDDHCITEKNGPAFDWKLHRQLFVFRWLFVRYVVSDVI